MSRYWEPRFACWVVQVLPGDLYVTRDPEVITTVLGSCVSACVRDVRRGIGGMNHFLLPTAPRGADDAGASTRYGVNALERLMNQVLRRTGSRDDLEIKVFGGGRVIQGGGDIGRTNIDFVREFFAAEGLLIAAQDVGDTVARRLRYWPADGRVQLARMPMNKATRVVDQETAAARRIAPSAGSVELF